MDITSPSIFMPYLQTARLKVDGVYLFLVRRGKSGNANPPGDPENPEQRERSKPRTDSRKPAKCGKFTNGLSETY